jgi:hypothetical protein
MRELPQLQHGHLVRPRAYRAALAQERCTRTRVSEVSYTPATSVAIGTRHPTAGQSARARARSTHPPRSQRLS